MAGSGPSNLRQLSSDKLEQVTGGFDNNNRLGKGGQGEVFQGSLHHRKVAVKRIELGDSQGSTDEAALEEVACQIQSFEDELKILNSLRHPHIVSLEAWGIHTRQTRDVTTAYGCIVMELMAGGSLQDRLFGAKKSTPMSANDRTRIAAEMSLALLEMHSRNYWHLDLKPHNILLDGHGTSKLCNLGIARLSAEQVSVRTGPKGSAGYVCPYWLLKGKASLKTDLYGLGIVYLQLLMGIPISNKKNPTAELHSLVAECEGCAESNGTNPVSCASKKAIDFSNLLEGGSSGSVGLDATLTPMVLVETASSTGGGHDLMSRWGKGPAHARDTVMAALDRSAWPIVTEKQVAHEIGAYQACGLAEIALRCIERHPQLRPTIEEVAEDCQKLLSGTALPAGPDALDRQGLSCSQGNSTTSQNHVERVQRLVGTAPPCDLNAIFEQGLSCLQGDVIALQNHGEAVHLFRLAAEGGHAAAQWRLGNCYAEGTGVPLDRREAVRLYRLAGAQGLAEGQAALGVCYEKGHGVQQDHAEAARLYGLAAAQGNAAAQSNLGYCYKYGHGVQQDYAEAVRLYGLAAAQGHASAQSNLGVCYGNGHGVQQDHAEAVRLYGLAAAQGARRRPTQPGLLLQERAWRAAGLCGGSEIVRAGGRAGARRRPTQPGRLLREWAWRAAGPCGGREVVRAGRRAGARSRPVQPGLVLREGAWRAAGLCGGREVVRAGSRAGARSRPVQPGLVLREGAWRAAGLCGGREVVRAGGRTGARRWPVQPGRLLRVWEGRTEGQGGGRAAVRPRGRAGA